MNNTLNPEPDAVGRTLNNTLNNEPDAAGRILNNSLIICVVCVEVLRPSQPNGVLSDAVSLPNHTFTGQA